MKESNFYLRVGADELENWRKRAKKESVSLSAWIRDQCNRTLPTAHSPPTYIQDKPTPSKDTILKPKKLRKRCKLCSQSISLGLEVTDDCQQCKELN